MDATIALVTERGTSAISMTELAEAAGVSRPVLYQHYGDRDRILVAAMTALIDRELMPVFDPEADPLPAVQLMTEHFAHYRRFYRALVEESEPLDPATRAAMLIRLDQTLSHIQPLALPNGDDGEESRNN